MRSWPENILFWNGVTRHDLPPERVIEGALEHKLKSVVILGYDENDQEYMASSLASGADVVWLMERVKHSLMTQVADE